MTIKFEIADKLKLPADFVPQTQAILAMRRRGKTYTASVMAEELLAARQQIVVIDITGAWWGLKSSASGKSPGYEIVVAGGEHADIPLDPGAGKLLADAITTDHFSSILDLKLLRKGQRMQFLADFLEAFAAINRRAVHLFCDEADDYCPQTILWKEPASSKCLGAMDDLVRRGGINGIGATLITQRPAVLNNNVLTQCQLLTLLRLTHPADLKPIREWVKVHATAEEEQEVMARLPMLGLGQAIIWSPGWPEDKPIGIREVQIRERTTFNSSRTPKAGERVTQPKRLSKVDVKKLGARITELAEKAKAEDPKALKAKIAELERAAKKAPAPVAAPKAAAAEVKKEALERAANLAAKKRDREWASWSRKLLAFLDRQSKHAGDAHKLLSKIAAPEEVEAIEQGMPKFDARDVVENARSIVSNNLAPRRDIPAPITNKKAPSSDNSSPSVITGGEGLATGEAAVLTAIIQKSDGISTEEIALLTGYRKTSRGVYINNLVRKGLAAKSDNGIVPTDVGRRVMPNVERLPTGARLREHWRAKLPAGEQAIFELAIARYPGDISKLDIEQATNYKKTSIGVYGNNLATRKLVTKTKAGLRANDNLF